MILTESLTQRRLQLLKDAQKNFGARNTWTSKENIYALVNNQKKLIRSYDDIIKLGL